MGEKRVGVERQLRAAPASSRLAPAAARIGALLLAGAPQAHGQLLGLLDIIVRGAPEDEASGHFADGHRHAQLARDPKDIVLHTLRPDLGPEADAGGLVGERLDLVPEGLIEHRFHTGSPAHAPGFLEGHVFEVDG
jgi:hypothetical protein